MSKTEYANRRKQYTLIGFLKGLIFVLNQMFFVSLLSNTKTLLNEKIKIFIHQCVCLSNNRISLSF